MYEIAIIIGAIIQVITLIVFFVMASNVSKIKKHLDTIAAYSNMTSRENENTEKKADGLLEEGMLVVELKTEKQMRIGKRLDNGKYECHIGGHYLGVFLESELMEFDDWVKNVYKK
jgi:hypothetical protein